jgi:hypothetical protein
LIDTSTPIGADELRELEALYARLPALAKIRSPKSSPRRTSSSRCAARSTRTSTPRAASSSRHRPRRP